MYIFEYSLIIMVNDVKLTVPWWRKGQRIWSGRIGNLYIHYIGKSIGSPPSNERFDYFSHFHEYKS